jgi:hypothetical protein
MKALCVFHPLGEGYYIVNGTVGVAEILILQQVALPT